MIRTLWAPLAVYAETSPGRLLPATLAVLLLLTNPEFFPHRAERPVPRSKEGGRCA